jgi:hypothetical protein
MHSASEGAAARRSRAGRSPKAWAGSGLAGHAPVSQTSMAMAAAAITATVTLACPDHGQDFRLPLVRARSFGAFSQVRASSRMDVIFLGSLPGMDVAGWPGARTQGWG